ncbi:MAG: dTDP-4-dehydrorhamnose reductase [Candidatus Omnitrophica bacterium]|nr:dTDP-4-dehydrorhamnose reductase [Candidatus Omnitrophota bacterium]
MTILITGSTGLLGQALVKRLALSGEVVGLSRHDVQMPGESAHVVCDLTDAQAARRAVRETAPDVVVHTQALSDVDRCELEPELAYGMNVRTVEHLCHALRARVTPVIALSTDYVFDGTKASPYDEADEPHPVSVYGRSKLDGERVALRHPHTYVIRPSTLFGCGRMNFCDAIVERAQQGQAIHAYTDQRTSPTYTEDLADGIGRLISVLAQRRSPPTSPIYHMTNAGGCSRVEFASRVVEWLGRPAALVTPIRMAEQRRPAPRPANSVLTSRYLDGLIGKGLRPWDEALHAYLRARHWIN